MRGRGEERERDSECVIESKIQRENREREREILRCYSGRQEGEKWPMAKRKKDGQQE